MSHTLGAAATAARRDEISALLAAGGLEACRDLVLDEVGTGARGTAWCTALTWAVVDAGDLRTASALAELLARVRRGSARRPARRADGRPLPPPAATSRPRASAATLRHDADQYALLRRRGLLGADYDDVIAGHRAAADRLDRAGAAGPGELTAEELRRIGHVLHRIVHVAEAPRVARALGGTGDGTAVGAGLVDGSAPVTVVDDVLTTPAWERLLRFCQESTVWSAGTADEGRVQATFLDGFTCPLLVQVAEELRVRFPHLIAGRPLAQLSAAKDAQPRSGPSARPARTTSPRVTLWLTPSAANLDAATGGLTVHGTHPVHVPYRGNRAVLLGTHVAHTVDAADFAPAYEHRRVAVTFDYGPAPG